MNYQSMSFDSPAWTWRVLALQVVCSALVGASGPARAQDVAGGAAVQSLGEVTVSAPLTSASGAAPALSLEGPRLLMRMQSTLGETLAGEPGVSSTYFGPNASRPVIRGLDGDRLRILSNGSGLLDVSGLSQDHAVSQDPLIAERIEVLRGPAALAFAGTAAGGVVNVIDNRIARQPQFGPEGGLSGKTDLGWRSGSGEHSGSVLLEGGHDRSQWHVDAFRREAGDVPSPVALVCNRGGTPVRRARICNSALQADGGAVGWTWFGDQGRVGASIGTHRSTYGVVAEDDVTIGMRANRYTLEGEQRLNAGPWQGLQWSLNHSDYAHTEFEGGQPGSRFATRGTELRMEARHAALGPWSGRVGVQLDAGRFSPDAPEPESLYAPPSKTTQLAAFVYEERPVSWGLLTAAARLTSVHTQSLGDGDAGRFAPVRRAFTPLSLALGTRHGLGGGWSMEGHAAYSERAPRDHELFAHGPHTATASYEIGNEALDTERSVQMDLGVQWREGAHRLGLNAYVHRFGNFILPVATGNQQGGLDEYRQQQVPALFRGLEVSGLRRLLSGSGTLDLGLRADAVRARNSQTGEPLPRIAPWRVGATLTWNQAPWSASLGADHAGAQRRVPLNAVGERPGTTEAYTLWNASASHRQRWGDAVALWYARLDNLTNQLAYSATSVLTATAFGRSPLPGRSLKAGLQLVF